MTEVNSMTHRDDDMGGTLVAAYAAIFFGCATAHPAIAQSVSRSDGPIACGEFQRCPNGFWTVLRQTTINSQWVRLNLAPGQAFAKNQFVSSIEVTTVLDRNCGNQ